MARNSTSFVMDLSRHLAYVGELGHQRKAFCERFAAFKRAVFLQMQAQVRQNAEQTGVNLTCGGPNCCHCCSQYVGCSLAEAELIVYHLYEDRATFDWFLKGYPRWREQVRRQEKLFQEVNGLFQQTMDLHGDRETQAKYNARAMEYFRLNITCPFLRDGRCAIYDVRPFLCAGFYSTTPPEYCDPASEAVPSVQMVLPPPEPPYYLPLGNRFILGPVPLLSYQILQNGFVYLDALPGLAGLFDRHCADPECEPVVAAFKTYR